MARTETILRVFLASPGDVEEERQILEDVVGELNDVWGRKERLRLELVKWETHTFPGVGEDAQDVINAQVSEYDIFIGILWKRFGTETKRYGSGTEEEFARALERYRQHPGSIRIMLYFKDAPTPISEVDPEQLRKISDFRKRAEEEGIYHWSYLEAEHFSKYVRMHLGRQMQDWGDKWGEASIHKTDEVELTDEGIGGAEEEGYFDLIIVGEESLHSLHQSLLNMTDIINELGKIMRQRAGEINLVRSENSSTAVRRAKAISDRTALDIYNFATRIEAELPIMSQEADNALSSIGKAVTHFPDFGGDTEELEDLNTQVLAMRKGVKYAKEKVSDFRDTLSGVPRATSKLIKAKKLAVRAVDEVKWELGGLEKQLDDTEEVIADTIEMINRRRARGRPSALRDPGEPSSLQVLNDDASA